MDVEPRVESSCLPVNILQGLEFSSPTRPRVMPLRASRLRDHRRARPELLTGDSKAMTPKRAASVGIFGTAIAAFALLTLGGGRSPQCQVAAGDDLQLGELKMVVAERVCAQIGARHSDVACARAGEREGLGAAARARIPGSLPPVPAVWRTPSAKRASITSSAGMTITNGCWTRSGRTPWL